MAVSRILARPLLSAIFVSGGLDALQHPESKVKLAEPVALPIAQQVPILPEDPVKLVQINGAVQVVAGSLLALGKFRRLAALALIGSIIPTTYAGHRFWEEEDEATRAQQRIHFLKNLGLLGGLILAAVDTEGQPSLGWRARRNASEAAKMIELGREIGVIKVGHVADQFAHAAEHVTAGGRHAQTSATVKSQKAAAKANRTAAKAANNANTAAAKAAANANTLLIKAAIQASMASGIAAKQARAQAKELAQQARSRTGPAVAAVGAGTQRAGEALSTGSGKAGELLSSGAGWAGGRAHDLRAASSQRFSG
jgi:uncharacterized membrane protein YphA (DoxX/SURF4 family)